MKVLALFLLMIFSTSLAQAQKKHHLIFVHGIGGNAQTFGYMPTALQAHLENKTPGTRFEPHLFVYDTGSPAYDTDDFAIQLAGFLKNKLGEMAPDDKFSFVTHSQGGLVATIWLFHAFRGQEFFHSHYLQNLDAIVTLGTPFWGSKLATIMIDPGVISWGIGKFGKAIVEKMGRRQLEEMALGSRTIMNFRNNVVAMGPETLHQLRSRFRAFSIAGMPRFFKDLEDYLGVESLDLPHRALLFGGKYFESDMAVSIPSARFDSIYTIAKETDYQNGQFVPIMDTVRSGFGPFMIVNTIHASPSADLMYDMAYVPSKCLNDPNCDHPTYKYVLNHMLGGKNPSFGKNVPVDDLGGFTVSFHVEYPESIEAKDQKLKVELLDDVSNVAYTVVLASSREVKSDFAFFHPTRKNLSYRHLTGQFIFKQSIHTASYRARKDGLTVRFRISSEGFKERIVETIIQPTYSTYVKLNLAQDLETSFSDRFWQIFK